MGTTEVANLVAKLTLDTSGFTASASSIGNSGAGKQIEKEIEDSVQSQVKKSQNFNDDDIKKRQEGLLAEVDDLTQINQNIDVMNKNMTDGADLVMTFGKAMVSCVTTSRDIEKAWAATTKEITTPEGVDPDAFFGDLKAEVYDLSMEFPATFQEIAKDIAESAKEGIGAEDLISDVRSKLEEEYGGTLDTLDAQLQMAENTVVALQAQLGDVLLPVLKDIAKELLPILQKASDFIAAHPGLATTITGVAIAFEGLGIAAQIASVAMAMGSAGLAPWIGAVAIIGTIIGLVVLLADAFSQVHEVTTATIEDIEKMDPAVENLVDVAGTLTIQDKFVKDENGDWVQFVPDGWGTGGEWVKATEEEIAILNGKLEETAALTNEVTENAVSEQLAESSEAATEAVTGTTDIMTQLNQQMADFNQNTQQLSATMDGGLTDSMTQLNNLMESDAFRQFSSQPIDPAVSESWSTFGDAVSKTTEGFASIQNNAEGFTTLPVISDDVIESYQLLGEAFKAINTALTGQTEDDMAATGMVPVEGAEQGPMGLLGALEKIPEMLQKIMDTAKALADYLTGDFIAAIEVVKKAMAVVETNDAGETNAGGGNTLYTALGAVQGVLESILTLSQAIANHWKGEMMEAVKDLKKASEIAQQCCANMASAAGAAKEEFAGLAGAIRDVISAIEDLNKVGIPDLGGGSGGGTPGKAAGGPVSGGTTYLVGEKGPELFTPNRSGYIIPNDDLFTASGGNTTITIQFNGDVIGDEESISAYVMQATRQAIQEEVYAAV